MVTTNVTDVCANLKIAKYQSTLRLRFLASTCFEYMHPCRTCCWKCFAKPSQNHTLDLSITIDPFTNEAQIKYSRTKFITRKLFSLPQYIFKYAWMFIRRNIATEIKLVFDGILSNERQTQFIDSAIVQYVGIDLAINFRDQKVRHTNQPMELVACRKVMTLTVPDTKSTTTDDCK